MTFIPNKNGLLELAIKARRYHIGVSRMLASGSAYTRLSEGDVLFPERPPDLFGFPERLISFLAAASQFLPIGAGFEIEKDADNCFVFSGWDSILNLKAKVGCENCFLNWCVPLVADIEANFLVLTASEGDLGLGLAWCSKELYYTPARPSDDDLICMSTVQIDDAPSIFCNIFSSGERWLLDDFIGL